MKDTKALTRSEQSALKHLAYHEAGHAVFAWALGAKVTEVTIVQSKECPAFCQAHGFRFDSSAILMALGGIRGQQMLCKRVTYAMREDASLDYQIIYDYLAWLPDADEKVTAQRLRYFERTSKRIIACPNIQEAIRAVADALIENTTLKNKDVKKLCLAAGAQPIP